MGEWTLVKDKLPKPRDCFGEWYIICDEIGQVYPMRYACHTIRGKYVERWETAYNTIYYGAEIYAWMPMPEPPVIKKEG